MPILDDLWDFDDPAASEARFRARLAELEGADPVDPAADAPDAASDAAETRTQLARALGLQGRFDEGYGVLDEVDRDHPAEDRVRVRSRLERGRLRRSGGDLGASVAPF